MIDRLYSFLGLICKSGNISSGDDVVEAEIKRNKCKLLIIAEDASDNTKKRFLNLANHRSIKYIIFGEKDLLGQSIGKSPRAVLCIKNIKLSKVFMSKYENYNNGGDFIVKD